MGLVPAEVNWSRGPKLTAPHQKMAALVCGSVDMVAHVVAVLGSKGFRAVPMCTDVQDGDKSIVPQVCTHTDPFRAR